MQDRLKNALHACVNNACFALEQLERAAHEATGVCFAESRKMYKLGKEHLVLCCGGVVQGICNVCTTVNLTRSICVLPQMKAKVSTPGGFTLLVVREDLLENENT